ncbi:unnamed protein product [Rotaria sp. Silwood1]|nr:unnamed protein product [Rotaria sp. Silwood1]CAF4963346.1 unnamed protein product [Rotaria sp. Silwood1]CAF4986143.1 unnamed protein product [Rotaria sp. Silwood1]
MFQLDALIDTSFLPSNVMSLRDDKFIDFVKAEAGDDAAALLEIQGINCVKSFLMTSNVYSIMDVNSKCLNDFKNKYGYMQDDGTFVIQPGIKGNTKYLIDLLKKKCIEDAKEAKSSKYCQSSSSTIAKSTSSVPFNSSPEKISTKFSNLSVGQHKTYIIDTLNSWCKNNESKFYLSQLSLIEGQHYFISFFNDPSGALKCDIKCCYEKWSSLTLRRGKFQLSNFYRHLQDLSNVCPELEKMINNPQLQLPSSTNTQLSLPTSDNVPQQVVSPTFISIIPPSNTTQPNSYLSTASSTSISTDKDENIIQQSSSLKTKKQVKRKVQTIESSYNTREPAKRMRRR